MLRARSNLLRRAALSVVGTALAVTGTAVAASATVTTVATALTAPTGTVDTVSAGGTTSTWVADHLLGFCRLDVAADGTSAINQATCLTNAVAPGQPVYDASRGIAYVPDLSSKSQGVWRYRYNATTNRFGSPTLINVTSPQRGNRPASAALDASGNLYFTTVKVAGIFRVQSPYLANGAAGLAMSNIGRTSDGGGSASLTYLNDTLYVAENGSVTSIDALSACSATARCVATDAGIAFTPRSLATDGVDTIYVGTNFDVESYTVSTGGPTTQVAANFPNAASLAVQASGAVLVGYDPTDGAQSLQGRLSRITNP